MKQANGATLIVDTLLEAGVDTYFTNPGTSEMHIVEALAASPVRSVLTLFEGVATGAADGYGRMLGKPAATLLHLGPGLANGLANLHNARRARTPIINLVGDHTSAQEKLDPPLASDIAAIAGTVSGWVRKIGSVESAAEQAAQAAAAAGGVPGSIATLIIPADIAWGEVANASDERSPPASPSPAVTVPEDILPRLERSANLAIFAGGTALREVPLRQLEAIAGRLGATLYCETFFARMERGGGRVEPKRLPYFPEQAAAELAGYDTILLVGARDPVAFFAYPSIGGRLAPQQAERIVLAPPDASCAEPVASLADRIGYGKTATATVTRPLPQVPQGGELTALAIGQAIAALLPEGAIVVDEANTGGGPAYGLSAGAAPHDWLTLTGGAIGQGLPVATGAAVACPDRKVISLQADGSAMYTLPALWTQARERLDVLTILFNNRSYAILGIEFQRLTGTDPAASAAIDQFSLDRPALDFIKLAEGMGVTASRATTPAQFVDQLRSALAERGPRLIEAWIG